MYRKYLVRSFDYRDSRIETAATSGFLGPAQLSNHAIARVRFSLVAGVDLALMKTAAMIPASCQLIATGARVIDDRGLANRPAAHALPCGISALGRGSVHQLPKSLVMQEFIAQPYKYTNVIPKAGNAADHRAEAFNRKNGTGLVGSFKRFCQRVLDTGPAPGGALDKGLLQQAFVQLIKDYQTAFTFALDNSRPTSSRRIIVSPGLGTGVNPDVPYTDREFLEDNIRTSLRGQIAAMKEFEGSSFSRVLIEQVESDFNATLKVSGEFPATAS
jgi:hypothetical protein